MRDYRCWIPVQEDERVGYGHRAALSAHDAAEEHAKSQYTSEDGRVVVVHVRDVESGALKVFNVHVDFEPTFWASEAGE